MVRRPVWADAARLRLRVNCVVDVRERWRVGHVWVETELVLTEIVVESYALYV